MIKLYLELLWLYIVFIIKSIELWFLEILVKLSFEELLLILCGVLYGLYYIYRRYEG